MGGKMSEIGMWWGGASRWRRSSVPKVVHYLMMIVIDNMREMRHPSLRSCRPSQSEKLLPIPSWGALCDRRCAMRSGPHQRLGAWKFSAPSTWNTSVIRNESSFPARQLDFFFLGIANLLETAGCEILVQFAFSHTPCV